MAYQITQTEDGLFVVSMSQPVEIARFASQIHARQFLRKVLGVDVHGAPCDSTRALIDGVLSKRAQHHTTPDAATIPEPSSVAEAGQALLQGLVPVPDPWEVALSRIAAGEGCKAVAEDMGLSFPSLRARWAARARSAKEDALADTPAVVENGHDTRSAEPASLSPATSVPVVDDTLTEAVAHPKAGVTATLGPATGIGLTKAVPKSLSLYSLTVPEEVEDVRGRPDLVRRRPAVWTDEIDMAVIEARDDEAALWNIAAKVGCSIERVKRRQTTLLESIAREIGN